MRAPARAAQPTPSRRCPRAQVPRHEGAERLALKPPGRHGLAEPSLAGPSKSLIRAGRTRSGPPEALVFARVSAPDPYAYSPYGTPYTAAPPEPMPTAPRPRLLIAVPVLMVLAALPFLLFGALFVAAPVAGIAQEVLASPNMQTAGATEALVVSAVRVLGGVILGVALLYLVFGFLAFAGRNWARITTAVLTGGFALLLVAGLVVSGGAIDTITLASVLLVLILGAVAILFSPGANAWYAARR